MNRPGQRIYQFPNGYGASVISYGYGSENGLLELAVLTADGRLTYSTPITNDVLGWLTQEEVDSLLVKIAALKPEDIEAERLQRKRAEIDAKREEIAALEREIAELEAGAA